MISVEDAIARILAAVQPLPVCRLPLASSLNHFAATDVRSRIDLPCFDNSAMDGYAVRAEDLRSASVEKPVPLRLTSRIPAGGEAVVRVGAGECVRLFTGSSMPAGADAVVMQEDVTATADTISFTEPVKPLENVRLRGEDVRSGTVLVRANERLTASRVGLLAAAGVSEVEVYGRSRIALVATGSELREPGEALRPGEIYESNRTMLDGLLAGFGATVSILPLVRDTLEQTTSALEQAFASADVVISTGGVSVGEFDFVKEALQRLGGEMDLWRVAMRPGKPFVFGRVAEKFLFGLPGNPVSAFVTFLLLVRPAILKMHGAVNLHLPRLKGELVDNIANRGDRRHFTRVRWESGKIYLAGPQKSHMIGSLARANALLDLAPGAEVARGSAAEVLVWELPET